MTEPSPKSDPIDELIDKQMASLWIENTGLGGRSGTWRSKSSGDKSMTNYVEDMFIEAMDRKYHYVSQQAEKMYDLLKDGFTQVEIAAMLGTSERNVRRIRKRLEEELTDV